MPLIRANGVELFFDLTGPREAPVVLFSNSIGTTIEMWDAQVAALSDRYRCLRYDTRGHGRSEVVDSPIGIDDLADDVAGLLDALEIPKAHVVGLSLGGMTAQALAARHPDRVGGLALMATAANMPPPEGWEQRAATVRRSGMAAIVDTVLPLWFTAPFIERCPDRVKPVRDRFLQIDPHGYAVCCGVIRDMDLRETIKAIEAPTLIIAGADDPSTPVAKMEEIRQRIFDSELVVVPRAAHLLAIERADRVNHHLRAFLDSLAPEGAGARPGSAAKASGNAARTS
jgi:3-oxoadipate enol-lactonase